MHISNLRYRHLSYEDLSALEGWMAYVAENGFDGIELIYRTLPCDMSLIARTKELVKRYGMPVSMVTSSHDNSVFTEEEKQKASATLKAYVNLATEFESQFIRVLARGYDRQRKEISLQRAIDAVVDVFERALPYAARQDVIFALENHPGFGAEKSVIQAILERIPDPYLGWNCDFVNAYRIEGQTLYDFLNEESLLSRLVHVHAKTFAETPDGWDIGVALDEGDLDVAHFLHIIKGTGYDGWISIEFGATNREKIIRSKQFIEKVWGMDRGNN